MEYYQTKTTFRKNKDKNNGATSYQKTKEKVTIENPHTPITTLNVNELNSAIKRHRVADQIKKQNPTIYCLQDANLSCKDKDRLKVKE